MKIVNLNQVLDENELLLVDTSFCGLEMSQVNLEGGIMNTRSLRKEKKFLERFTRILLHPNSLTIPEVSKELERLINSLRGNLNFYYGREGYDPYNDRLKNRVGIHKNPPKIPKKRNKNKRLLKGVLEEAEEGYKASLAINLRIEDEKYEVIFDMIKSISEILELNSRDSHKNNDTDLRLTAFLYYASLTTDIHPSLLSNDRGFIDLLGITPRVLCDRGFLPYNLDFLGNLDMNSFSLYRSNSNPNFLNAFYMMDLLKYAKRVIKRPETFDLKEKITPLFERYYALNGD